MKPFRERSPIVVGLISTAVLAVLTLFAFSINRFPFITRVFLIEADFADASGLTPENEVRVAGLKVGKVRSVELADDRVRVTMEVRNGTELGSSPTAEIKLKTVLGSKFVAVTPRGGKPDIGSGDRIPLERTIIPFELYQVTNETVSTLGKLDAQALNDSLRALADLTEDPSGNFGRALDGLAKATGPIKERDAELESLLGSSDKLLGALAARSDELGRILDSGSKLLGALAAKREGLKSFVVGADRVSAQLAGLLRDNRASLDPALRDLHAVLLVVAGRQAEVEDVVRYLGPSGESFARAITNGTWADIFTESLLIIQPPPDVTPGRAARATGLRAILEAAR